MESVLIESHLPITDINPTFELPSNLTEMGNLFKTEFFLQFNTGVVRQRNTSYYCVKITLLDLEKQGFVEPRPNTFTGKGILNINGNLNRTLVGQTRTILMSIGISDYLAVDDRGKKWIALRNGFTNSPSHLGVTDQFHFECCFGC